jgi:hypothetical protein
LQELAPQQEPWSAASWLRARRRPRSAKQPRCPPSMLRVGTTACSSVIAAGVPHRDVKCLGSYFVHSYGASCNCPLERRSGLIVCDQCRALAGLCDVFVGAITRLTGVTSGSRPPGQQSHLAHSSVGWRRACPNCSGLWGWARQYSGRYGLRMCTTMISATKSSRSRTRHYHAWRTLRALLIVLNGGIQ